jgi:hypothetical protein
MSSLRATRLNVLETRNLAAYEAGDQIYPGAASFARADLERAGDIEAAIKRRTGGKLQDGEFAQVPIAELITLIPELPFNEDLANMWDPEMLARVLERTSARYEGQGYLFFREMKRTKDTLPTGALSGTELEKARALQGPVLCVFRDDGRKLDTKNGGQTYWYPTLVLPSTMATQLFNTTP